MPTLVDLAGFEDQVLTANATTTMNPKLWDTVANNGAGTVTYVTGRGGVGKAVKFDLDGVNQCRLARNLTTAGTMMVASFYVQLLRLPSAQTSRIFHMSSDLVGLIGIGTDGALRASFGSGTGIVTSIGPTITVDGRFHLIDVKFDTSPATHTVDWYVDGVAQSQGSAGGVAASNMTLWSVGSNTTTHDAAFIVDDVVISTTSGDFPMGRHSVFSVVPNDDNAASVYGTNVMEQGNGTDLSSSNKGYQYLDEWPPTTGTNNADSVTQSATGTGNFVDVEFENAPAWAVSTLWGVRGIVAHQSDGTAANNGTTRIVDSAAATLTDVFPNADMSETSAHYTARMITAPGGGWTITNFNGVRGRVGLSSDASPSPEWLALMLQAATPDNPIGYPFSRIPRRRSLIRSNL